MWLIDLLGQLIFEAAIAPFVRKKTGAPARGCLPLVLAFLIWAGIAALVVLGLRAIF